MAILIYVALDHNRIEDALKMLLRLVTKLTLAGTIFTFKRRETKRSNAYVRL